MAPTRRTEIERDFFTLFFFCIYLIEQKICGNMFFFVKNSESWYPFYVKYELRGSVKTVDSTQTPKIIRITVTKLT